MEDIVSVIRSIVREEIKCCRTLELGTVTKLYSHESGDDKYNYACNVKLKDSDLELQNIGISTQRIGAVAIPNENDLVLVQFINGDVNNAVVIGRVYNDVDRPPVAKPHEFVYISPDSKESGIRRVYLEFPDNNKFLLNDEETSLEAGKTKIKFKHDGDIEIDSNSKFNIKANGEINIEAGKTRVKLNPDGDIEIDSNSKLSIKTESDVSIASSGNVSLDSKGNLDLKTQGNVSFDSKGNIDLKAQGNMTLKATTISLN
jgi:phage baseplate assembly protein gpV